AGAADHLADGDGGLVELHANPGQGGDFVDRGTEAAARGIAHAAYGGRGSEHVAHQRMQGRGIAFDGSLEADVLAFGEDGDSVVAKIPTEQDHVPGASVGGGEVYAATHASDARGVDEHAVAA